MARQGKLLWILGIVMLMSVVSVSATSYFVSYNPSVEHPGVYNNNCYGESFYTAVTGTTNYITLNLSRVGTMGLLNITLRAASCPSSQCVPSGTPLAKLKVRNSDITTTDTQYDLAWDVPYTFPSKTVYAVTFCSPTSTNIAYPQIGFKRNAAGRPANYNGSVSTDGGINFAVNGFQFSMILPANVTTDHRFRITAKNYYNLSSINKFNISVRNNANYTTTNGTVETNITRGTRTLNITFSITNYTSRLYNNQATDTDLVGSIRPYPIIRAFAIGTNIGMQSFSINYSGTSSGHRYTNAYYMFLPYYNGTWLTRLYNASGYKNVNVTLGATPSLFSYNFSVGAYKTVKVHFYDEENNTLISGKIALTMTSSNISKINSTTNGSIYYSLVAPNSYIFTYNQTSKYPFKYYYFTVTDTTTLNLNMYASKQTSPLVTFKVSDALGNPVPNSIVEVLRHVGTSTYYTIVSMGKTNANGETDIPIILTTVPYEIEVVYNGNLVYAETEGKAIPASAQTNGVDIVVNLNSITNAPNYYNYVQHILSQSYTSNPITGVSLNATYIYNDPYNIVSRGCVAILSSDVTGNVKLNESCLNSPAGAIMTSISHPSFRTASYVIIGTIILEGHTYTDIQYVSSTSLENIKTKDSLWIFFMLIFTLGIAGFVLNPSLGFVGFALGFIAMMAFDAISATIGFPIVVICFILAYITYRARYG